MTSIDGDAWKGAIGPEGGGGTFMGGKGQTWSLNTVGL